MAGTGSVEVFNNTLSDCAANNSANASGSRGAFSVGGGPATLIMHLRNNIAYQLPGEIYIDGSTAQITGDKNLWFGVGSGPAQTTNNFNADPVFANRAIGDYHLLAGSPAINTGLTVVPNNSFEPNPGRPLIQTKMECFGRREQHTILALTNFSPAQPPGLILRRTSGPQSTNRLA